LGLRHHAAFILFLIGRWATTSGPGSSSNASGSENTPAGAGRRGQHPRSQDRKPDGPGFQSFLRRRAVRASKRFFTGTPGCIASVLLELIQAESRLARRIPGFLNPILAGKIAFQQAARQKSQRKKVDAFCQRIIKRSLGYGQSPHGPVTDDAREAPSSRRIDPASADPLPACSERGAGSLAATKLPEEAVRLDGRSYRSFSWPSPLVQPSVIWRIPGSAGYSLC